MKWQDQVRLDMEVTAVDVVFEAMMETCRFTDDRNISAEAKAALREHGLCWWAIPRSLAVTHDELRLMGGIYFRAWVCELDGIKVDGHIYVNADSGCCQICGK